MRTTPQPGQAAFRSVLPEDIDWEPFAAFPPARRAHARVTIILGAPHLSIIAGPGIVTQVILQAVCATT